MKGGTPMSFETFKAKCSVPNCKYDAVRQWAFVPVCKLHYSDIMLEALRYYRSNAQSLRHVYHSISHLIPWAAKSREVYFRRKAGGTQ